MHETGVNTQLPPAHVSMVHLSWSSQVLGVNVQTPATHVSMVHRSLSTHDLALCVHVAVPAVATHASIVHRSPSSQFTGVFTHWPVATVQLSVVQGLKSLHAPASGLVWHGCTALLESQYASKHGLLRAHAPRQSAARVH